MWLFGQTLINGIMAGGVYALLAVGVTIIFGVMRIVNFAAGSFLVVGMYMTWLGYSLTGFSNYILIPFTLISIAVIAYIIFKLTMAPIINKERNSAIIITVGLSFLLQNLVILIFGSVSLTVPSEIKTNSLAIGTFAISYPRLIAFVVSLLLVVLVSTLLNKTSIGRAMRSTSESIEISEMLGINTRRIFEIAWVLGICLTGLAGLLITPLYYVESAVGILFRTTPMIAVVLGGMGNIKGAFISGIFLGIIEAIVSTYISANMGPAGIFVVFIVALYFFPNGLFGKGERVA